MDTNEIEVLKSVAHKMTDFFATKNVNVKHTTMLEALAAGFDTANWRTLRARLATESTGVEATEVDPVKRTWKVSHSHAAPKYYTNGTLLETVVAMEARAIAGGEMDVVFTEVEATDVAGSYAKQAKKFLTAVEQVRFSNAIKTVVAYARIGLGAPPSRGLDEAERYDREDAPITLLDDTTLVFENRSIYSHAEGYADYLNALESDEEKSNFKFDFENLYGHSYGEFLGTEIMQHVYKYALKAVGSIDTLSMERQIAFLKFNALMTVLADVMNHAFWVQYQDGVRSDNDYEG